MFAYNLTLISVQIANVWLLLTFSYMMLYHFDPPLNKKLPHWTEIFVIITVTTILLDHIRQVKFNITLNLLPVSVRQLHIV